MVAEKITNTFWDAYDNHTESDVYLSGAGRVRNMRDDEIEVFKIAMREIMNSNNECGSLMILSVDYNIKVELKGGTNL